jgi:hypothetical protein
MSHDGGRNIGNRDAHVLVLSHGGAEVEVLDVNTHKFGGGRGEDAIEEDLGRGDVSSSGANLAGVLN